MLSGVGQIGLFGEICADSSRWSTLVNRHSSFWPYRLLSAVVVRLRRNLPLSCDCRRPVQPRHRPYRRRAGRDGGGASPEPSTWIMLATGFLGLAGRGLHPQECIGSDDDGRPFGNAVAAESESLIVGP
jgi:hypothetical protein